MDQLKLLIFAFGISSITTSALCVLTGNPLIYHPVDYSGGSFLQLSLLMLVLSFGLVYITLPVLHWLKRAMKLQAHPIVFYIISTLVALQLVTMFFGYVESFFTPRVQADALYYYKCVTNSCLYIFAGNVTAVFIAYLYAQKESAKAPQQDAQGSQVKTQ